ncbi:MAG: hypothetical protein AB8E15_06665 [Bdellovibrionales bacterium]
MKSKIAELILISVFYLSGSLALGTIELRPSCNANYWNSNRDPVLLVTKLNYRNSPSRLGSIILVEFKIERALSVLKGHFPGNPILPGVYQTHLALLAIRSEISPEVRIQSIESVKNLAPALPGDQIQMNIRIVKYDSERTSWYFESRNTVNDSIIAKGTFITHRADSKAINNELPKKSKPLYSVDKVKAFLPHGDSIFFPFEVTGLKSKDPQLLSGNISKSISSSLANLVLPGTKVTVRTKIPENHLLLDHAKAPSGERILSNAFLPELAAQVSIANFIGMGSKELPFKVRLTETKNAIFYGNIIKGDKLIVQSEITKSRLRGDQLLLYFEVSIFKGLDKEIAKMELSGFFSTK